MSATLPKILLPNPGLPGFARFGTERFEDSRPLAQIARLGLSAMGGPENFPAGKFCTQRESASGVPALSRYPEHREIPKTFLQESFSRALGVGVSRTATAAARGGRLMPLT